MVSRETSISQAIAQLGLKGLADDEGVRRLARYASLLESEAMPRGFLGPAESSRILERHVLESVALATLVAPMLTSLSPAGRAATALESADSDAEDSGPNESKGILIDVGSGAGLPGIPLACVTGAPVVLVESEGRRASFLREVIRELGVEGEVVRGRAEDVARGRHRETGTVVVARAIAPTPAALELTLPFVRPGGDVVLMIGADEASRTSGVGSSAPSKWSATLDRRETGRFEVADEDTTPEAADPPMWKVMSDPLERAAVQLGGLPPSISRFDVPGSAEARWALVVHKINTTAQLYPRRSGVPQRNPLG